MSQQGTLSQQARILVIEDDERIVRLLDRFLGERGYELHFERDCVLLSSQVTELAPDLILLDWMLPTKPGIEILRDLRKDPQFASLPVIMLTARDDELDRVEGLLTGADDYVGKPFSLAELEARIITVLRRSQGKCHRYVDTRLDIDPDEKRLFVQGKKRVLTIQEWALLAALLRARQALSRQTLAAAVWGKDYEVSARTIDVMILKLRRIIEPQPKDPIYILTERGAGYRFSSGRVERGQTSAS